MGSLSRKMARNKAKKLKKHFKEKISLFSTLDNQCMMCERPFDKTSKEDVISWYVIVREDKKQVRLYCPGCWSEAAAAVGDILKKEEKNEA
jgi:hypothetical protein